jgi:uncharacterized membrane protein
MDNPKYIVLAALFLLSLASSGILVLYDLKPLQEICSVGEGCYVVKNSEYNTLFFNIPNEYLALAFFLSLFSLTAYQMFRPSMRIGFLINAGIVVASVFAVYSIYLQAFVIGTYCKYCMVMDTSIFLALAMILLFRN